MKHLKKAELSQKGKEQRERGICDERLLDHQLTLTSHFEAKKDLRPVSPKHCSCTTATRSPVLSATSFAWEEEGRSSKWF